MKRFVIAAIFVATAGPALAQSCGNLFFQRNAIYKDQGYCFHTPRAIAAFGNGGCQYDDVNEVPLSANQRRTVAMIRDRERAMGCGE